MPSLRPCEPRSRILIAMLPAALCFIGIACAASPAKPAPATTAVMRLVRENVRLSALPACYQPRLAPALSPDGKRLAIGRGNRLVVHDLQATNFPVLLDTNACLDAVRSLAWSPDGRSLASGSYREVTVRNPDDFAVAWRAAGNLLGRVSALVFTPFGGALVAADNPTAEAAWVRIFAADTGREINGWPAHDDAINALAVSPDGGRLATAGGDKLVRLWEVISHNEIARYEGHVGADKQLKIWELFAWVKGRERAKVVRDRSRSGNSRNRTDFLWLTVLAVESSQTAAKPAKPEK